MRVLKSIFGFFALAFICVSIQAFAQEEKTYSISLVKTANIQQQVQKIDGKKVLVESHKIKKGEHVWQILRDKGLLKSANLPELLTILKKLNKSFKNLDLIHPGQKLLVPLKIVPIKGLTAPKSSTAELKVTLPELEKVKLENYTVRPGDNIVKIVTGKYSIPPARLYTEYLNLVKKLNPDLKDLNRIYPGQKIRLPIYSPQMIRKPIKKKKPAPRPSLVGDEDKANPAWKDLQKIFIAMEEEWVQEGEHFIPLKSGGQIDLKASSFPVINLLNDKRIIVDIYNKLPDKMARLIEASWGNYKVIHLLQNDGLKACLDKILRATGYPRILSRGEPLELGGQFPLTITGDWVIVRANEPMEKYARIVVLNILGENEPRLCPPLKQFLNAQGIKIIEYPGSPQAFGGKKIKVDTISTGQGVRGVARTLLRVTGHKFRENIEIPVYGNQQKEFNLIIKADLFFKNKDKDAIIDFSGLGKDIASFLKEHQFELLSLPHSAPSLSVVSHILDFLGVANDEGVHPLMGADRATSHNVTVSINGVIFTDSEKNVIFAIPKGCPLKIQEFLIQKGFRLMEIP